MQDEAEGKEAQPAGQGAEPQQVPGRQGDQSHMWGMLCHLTALAGLIGVPFGHIIGPLVVWLIKKNEMPFVDEQGKESLNFQISMTIYGFVAALLILVLIGIPLFIALVLADVILVIVASVKASNGESFHYPCTIKFFK